MKRTTYRIDDDNETLISEEEYNSAGDVIYIKDYQSKPVLEKHFSYGVSGKLESEVETCAGTELDREEITYDKKGVAIEQKHFIGGLLYERTLFIEKGNGFERINYQDGAETEKVIRVKSGTDDYEDCFYENGLFIEKQTYCFDQANHTATLFVYDADGNIVLTRTEQFDDKKRLIEVKEYNENSNLVKEVISTYEGDLLIEEIHRQFLETPYCHHLTFTYDNNKNLLKKEARSSAGNLLSFNYYEYDPNNRLISENGYTLGSFNAIYGTSTDHTEYCLRYKYEE